MRAIFHKDPAFELARRLRPLRSWTVRDSWGFSWGGDGAGILREGWDSGGIWRNESALINDDGYYTFAARSCGDPGDIPQGRHEGDCHAFSCRVTYSCDPGFDLVGRANRYCQADGTWTPQELPICVRKFISSAPDWRPPPSIHRCQIQAQSSFLNVLRSPN